MPVMTVTAQGRAPMHPHPQEGKNAPYRPAGVPDTPAFAECPQMDMVKNLLKLFSARRYLWKGSRNQHGRRAVRCSDPLLSVC